MAELIIFAVLLALGYVFGSMAEHNHYKSIRERETDLEYLVTTSSRFPPASQPAPATALVTGNVVISIDYFKRIAAMLRSLVGGRVGSFETLLDRARREAVLRMKAAARELGADSVINVKIETASISRGQNNAIGSVEVYACGTALINSSAGA